MGALKTINKTSKNIVGYDFVYLIEDGLDENQIKEERRKVDLIKQDSRWEESLISLESHWYLNGNIGFIIDFSSENLDSFKEYAKKIEALFVKEFLEEKESFIFKRALFAKGNI